MTTQKILANSTYRRTALRLLFILAATAAKQKDGTAIFVGEKRLMALDFYIRYPDYLADWLLDEFSKSGDGEHLSNARICVEGEEPVIRSIKMRRYLFGAFDRLDTSMSILRAYGLVKPKRDLNAPGKPYTFNVEVAAFKVIENAQQEHPELAWYSQQLDILLSVFNGESGGKLKAKQYEIEEYEQTPLNQEIPSIIDRVRLRLEQLEAGQIA